MTRFEYLSVLLSIVIALGMSEIVAVWGRLLRRHRELHLSWIHAGWSLLALVLLVQMWWGFWNYRVVAEWSFLGLLMVIGDALLLVLAALVITPSDRLERGLDLWAFFLESRRLFFGLGALLLVELSVSDTVVSGQPVMHAENAIRLAGLGLVALAVRTESAALHGAIVAIGFLLVAGFTVMEFRT